MDNEQEGINLEAVNSVEEDSITLPGVSEEPIKEKTQKEEERFAQVIVPDEQLSLAIGKSGQNARLAAKLTNWKIDIKSESQFRELLEKQENEEIEVADEEEETVEGNE